MGAEPVLIACALAREGRAVRRARARAGAPERSFVLVTGMGEVAALRAVAPRLDGVAAVVVCGVAGGCDRRLRPATVVVASALLRPGESPRDLRPCPAPCGAVSAPIAALATIVDGAADRDALARAGAAAVEMESWFLAEACAARGLPLAVVRGVADTPGAPLGVAAGVLRPGDRRPRLSAVGRLALRPGRWAALLRLGRSTRRAERAAARVAVQVAIALGS